MRTAVGIVAWHERTRAALVTEWGLAGELASLVKWADGGGVKAVLAGHARRHAWRAEQWARVVPVLHDAHTGEPQPLVEPLGPQASPADRLVACYGVRFPALLACYERWSGDVRAFADGPLGRVLAVVVDDLVVEQEEGTALLDELALTAAPTAFQGA